MLCGSAQAIDDSVTMTVGDTKTLYANISSRYSNVLYDSCVWESMDSNSLEIVSQP